MRKAVYALFVLFVTITLFVSACANQVGEQMTDEQVEFEQQQVLELAEQELLRSSRHGITYSLDLPPSSEELRWFVLPQETMVDLQDTAIA